MGNVPIAVELNEPERLVHVRHHGREVAALTYAEARALAAELAAELLSATRMPIAQALATLMDDLAGALGRRGL